MIWSRLLALGLVITIIVIIDSCHLLSCIYVLYIVLSPMYAFSYLILVLSTFFRVDDFEAREDETLTEVTRSQEPIPGQSSSRACSYNPSITPAPSAEGKNILAIWCELRTIRSITCVLTVRFSITT